MTKRGKFGDIATKLERKGNSRWLVLGRGRSGRMYGEEDVVEGRWRRGRELGENAVKAGAALQEATNGKSERIGKEEEQEARREANALASAKRTGRAAPISSIFRSSPFQLPPRPFQIAERPRCCTFGRDLITLKASPPCQSTRKDPVFISAGTRCVPVRIIPHPFDPLVNFVRGITIESYPIAMDI